MRYLRYNWEWLESVLRLDRECLWIFISRIYGYISDASFGGVKGQSIVE